jgi:hypothetical protein
VVVVVVVAAMWLCGYVAIEYSQMMDGCDAPRGDECWTQATQAVGCSTCNVGKRFHPASQPGALCSSASLLLCSGHRLES